jgi:hypothetical protein
MDKARRTHARFPCNLKVEVFSGPVGGVRIGEGLLMDVSVSGGLLKLKGMLKVGATYRLHLEWKEGKLDLPGRVARMAGRVDATTSYYGLAFNLTYDQEKSLMRLVDLVRRGDPGPGEDGFSRSMRDYWS